MNPRNGKLCVIIPAAGAGRRMKRSLPKPLLRLGDRSILEWTLLRFSNTGVHQMILAVSDGIRDEAEAIRTAAAFPGRIDIVKGGRERQDSVWNALGAADSACTFIAVHDAARPFFDPGIFPRALDLLRTYDGVIAAVPAAYTLKMVSGGCVERTLPREALWQVNTPQVFRRKVLQAAYAQAMEEGFYGTDDSMLVERYGGTVAVVPDSPYNIKITSPADLYIAEKIIEEKTGGRI
jgi:2-C-methyl-D-erythritol 4-phosphate cytidylyltransferase